MEQIFEIKFTHYRNMPRETRTAIEKEVSKKSTDFKKNWKGICKVVYVTESPPRIKSIEPVEGRASECFQKGVGVDFNVF